MKDKNSFILYKSFYPPISFLTLEQKGKLFDAIFRYQIEGITEVDDDIRMPFLFFVNQFKVDDSKYEELCSKRRAAGGKGGAPKGNQNALKYNQNNQMVEKQPKQPNENKTTKTSLNDNENDNDNENENDSIIESNDSLSVVADLEEKISYVEIVNFYNNTVKDRNIPQCIKVTEKRKQAIKARVVEFGKEKVFEAITKAANSSFCNGSNNRNWKADFDFIFNSNKMANILEGRYDNENGRYGNNGNSNEKSAREVGEKVLGDIFAEIEERRRLEGTAD